MTQTLTVQAPPDPCPRRICHSGPDQASANRDAGQLAWARQSVLARRQDGDDCIVAPLSQALQSMRDTYEGPTARAEGAVFPSVMAAFFAALALGSLAAAFLAVRGSRPRTATMVTMALWCLVAILMFLGAGAYTALHRLAGHGRCTA